MALLRWLALVARWRNQGAPCGISAIRQLASQHLLVDIDEQSHIPVASLPGDLEGRAAILREMKSFKSSSI